MPERIHFRLIQMPCCGMLYCHVNPRIPNYCPECGKCCYVEIKSGTHTLDEWNGWLRKDESYTYLASPYAHVDPAIMDRRYEIARHAARWFLVRHIWVYSPIVHCHEIAKRWELPRTWDFWRDYNDAMLAPAKRLMILAIDGWQDSAGINHEAWFAQQHDIPIEFVRPRSLYDLDLGYSYGSRK